MPVPKDCEGAIIYQALEDPNRHLTEFAQLRKSFRRVRRAYASIQAETDRYRKERAARASAQSGQESRLSQRSRKAAAITLVRSDPTAELGLSNRLGPLPAGDGTDAGQGAKALAREPKDGKSRRPHPRNDGRTIASRGPEATAAQEQCWRDQGHDVAEAAAPVRQSVNQ